MVERPAVARPVHAKSLVCILNGLTAIRPSPITDTPEDAHNTALIGLPSLGVRTRDVSTTAVERLRIWVDRHRLSIFDAPLLQVRYTSNQFLDQKQGSPSGFPQHCQLTARQPMVFSPTGLPLVQFISHFSTDQEPPANTTSMQPFLNASNGDPVSRRPAGVKSQDSGTKLVPLFAAVKRPKKGAAFHWVYS
jgi:hypothetical protein